MANALLHPICRWCGANKHESDTSFSVCNPCLKKLRRSGTRNGEP